MDFKPKPQIVQPFSDEVFADLQNHAKEVRRLFDWPGIDYHDKGQAEENLFNRWYWHNLPLMLKLHHQAEFIALASELAGQELKPSYSFLSMYGPEGVCPKHTDRPQCQFTIDLQIDSDGDWPIYVEEKPYVLKNGQGLFYSGTGQEHYRNSMKSDSASHEDPSVPAKRMTLGFFHFVPVSWVGGIQ